MTDEAKHWIVDKTCVDRSYGARPLRRAIQKYIEDELSEALIQGALEEEKLVQICCEDGKLALRPLRGKEIKNATVS